jgi:hypothetical protein
LVAVVLVVLMRLLVHQVPEEEVPVVLDQVKEMEMEELLILVVVPVEQEEAHVALPIFLQVLEVTVLLSLDILYNKYLKKSYGTTSFARKYKLRI